MLKKPGTGSQDWRIPRTWLGAWIGIIILASVLAATAGAQTSAPSGCTFLGAPGAVPAFCDTFDQPAGTGNRSGDLNGAVWGVSTAPPTIISGRLPSVNSGASERPHPRERSPPKPLSARRRKAALTESCH